MAFSKHVANRVLVKDAGRLGKEGPPAQVLRGQQQPRTREVLARLLER